MKEKISFSITFHSAELYSLRNLLVEAISNRMKTASYISDDAYYLVGVIDSLLMYKQIQEENENSEI